jgi:hypothetical protein
MLSDILSGGKGGRFDSEEEDDVLETMLGVG